MQDLQQFNLKKGSRFNRFKKMSQSIDMTPMVDLGFLLITFFIFTTTMSQPMAIKLVMPDDGVVRHPTTISESLALSLVLDEKNKVYYYSGSWESARLNQTIYTTNYSIRNGIGKIIREKQKQIDLNGKFGEGRGGLVVLIKPTNRASYQNTIDALDEMLINNVKKYAIVELTKHETLYIDKMKAK